MTGYWQTFHELPWMHIKHMSCASVQEIKRSEYFSKQDPGALSTSHLVDLENVCDHFLLM